MHLSLTFSVFFLPFVVVAVLFGTQYELALGESENVEINIKYHNNLQDADNNISKVYFTVCCCSLGAIKKVLKH